MAYDIETIVDRTGTGAAKWDAMRTANPEVPAGIAPFSVADVDLKLAPVITEGLRERHPQVPTVVVELQPELARHLRERFPGAEVRAEPAHAVLADHEAGTAGAVVVSSLPFRSLPSPWRERTSLAIEHFLLAHPQRRMVQYTYQPRVPPFELTHGSALRWRRVGMVWRNAPPAWVWELRTRDGG